MRAGIATAGSFQVALVGAAVTTVCDANHVRTETLSYTEPFLFGQAWWVFPNFFVAFLVMSLSYLALSSSLSRVVETRESRSAGSLAPFVQTLSIFALVYLLSGFAHERPVLLTVAFYGAFLARWALTYERAWLLLLAALMAAGGMLAEGVIGAAGLATYRHSDVFHVPFWLGGLYLHGAFALRETMRVFVYR